MLEQGDQLVRHQMSQKKGCKKTDDNYSVLWAWCSGAEIIGKIDNLYHSAVMSLCRTCDGLVVNDSDEAWAMLE